MHVHTWLYLTSIKSNRRSVKVIFILKILYISQNMMTSIIHQSFGVISRETTMKDLESKSEWDTNLTKNIPSQNEIVQKGIKRSASPHI